MQPYQRKKMLRVFVRSIEYIFQTLGSDARQDNLCHAGIHGTAHYLIEILVVFLIEMSVRVDEFHYLTPNFAFTLSVRSVVSQP